MTAWHRQTISEAQAELRSDVATGLPEQEVTLRRQQVSDWYAQIVRKAIQRRDRHVGAACFDRR